MKLPDRDFIKKLHEKYAPSPLTLDMVWTHCQIVAEIAEQLIDSNHLVADRELVRVGALLHDIGAYKFIDAEGVFDEKHYIQHGVEGCGILNHEQLDEHLARIAERHTGVGLTKEHILTTNLPLLPKDYIAESLEERLVMYADKFHSKPPHFNAYESYMAHARKFGEENAKKFEAFAQEFGIPDLKELSQKYNQPIL